MAAPKNAITVREEAEPLWVAGPGKDILGIPVESHCGFKGELGDLLCDPDDNEPVPNDFWCPICESRDWYFV